MRNVCTCRYVVWAAALALCTQTTPTIAQDTQTAPLASREVAIQVDSGPIVHRDGKAEVVFSTVVRVPDATWLRLNFDQAVLAGDPSRGTASHLIITSLLDGAYQYLDSNHVRQWRNSSAYFNGDAVKIELIAVPGLGTNRIIMSDVTAGIRDEQMESICDSVDDRQLSSDPRAARAVPIGCTAWLFNDAAHCFMTAGHCTGNLRTIEFNVPLSNSNGSIVHPPPEDQYAVDPDSLQHNGGQGIGNDWAYFGCFPNSNTGLTPFEAQGDAYTIELPPAVNGQDIRITGYGVVGSPVPPSWNQVQKTHAGPFATSSGSLVQYRTDTTGGNSGSPVINEDTGFAIGIHTHGGCQSGGSGQNSGTGVNHSGLQDALATPCGVCESALEFSYPDGLPEFILPAGGTIVRVDINASGDLVIEPGTAKLNVDTGSGYVAYDMIEVSQTEYDAIFPEATCTEPVAYYFSATSNVGDQFTDPREAPDSSYGAIATNGVNVIANMDFETSPGWTVTNQNVLSGPWERGLPAGQGFRGDPIEDFDGSGQCWVTGLADTVDVDGGPTRLTSSVFDLGSAPNATVQYARWLYNDDALNGDPSDDDFLDVHISNDGGNSWTLVETVAHFRGWILTEFRVSDFVTPTSQTVLRFSVADSPNNSVTEGAIDALRIFEYLCSCPADFNGDSVVNTLDFLAFLNAFSAGDPAADFNGDGNVNTLDFIDFLNAFNVGC